MFVVQIVIEEIEEVEIVIAEIIIVINSHLDKHYQIHHFIINNHQLIQQIHHFYQSIVQQTPIIHIIH